MMQDGTYSVGWSRDPKAVVNIVRGGMRCEYYARKIADTKSSWEVIAIACNA